MKTPIKIWYHTTMIGRYIDIALDIFDAVEKSGLYAKCESLNVGVLGDESELPKLKEVLERYPKAKIVAYSDNKQFFEFHTLEHLKKEADTAPRFYALYLHDKGVTADNENDYNFKTFWRDYLVYWTVTKWKKCYHALDLRDLDDHYEGYDIAAVRVVAARKSINSLLHSSGNIWWAASDYIKSLPLIEAATYFDGQKFTGGFYPEMWSFSEQPIVYMPCNMFQMGFPYDKGMTFKEYWKQLPNKRKYLL